VIICTLADEAKRAYTLGAAGYLMKPILEDDLVREVARVLKGGE
jgi:DNA-binding NarL/FixJ family response regulator